MLGVVGDVTGEVRMGLFGKKKTETCPICGNEMDAGIFGDSIAVDDGTICGDCERILRGEYDIEHYYVRRFFDDPRQPWREKTFDPLTAMTVDEIREMIDELKEAQAATVAEYGGEYSALLTVESVTRIAPKALDVGLKRAKELKNKLVVRGLVQLGSFAKGDSVLVVSGEGTAETRLLDVIPCGTGSEFDTELRANIHKTEAPVNTNAWLILGLEDGCEEQDLVAKA